MCENNNPCWQCAGCDCFDGCRYVDGVGWVGGVINPCVCVVQEGAGWAYICSHLAVRDVRGVPWLGGGCAEWVCDCCLVEVKVGRNRPFEFGGEVCLGVGVGGAQMVQ